MNISLQFEPLDCSFYDWPSADYAVQPPSPPPLNNINDNNNTYDTHDEWVAADPMKSKPIRRCLHAIDELLQTERDYTKDLNHLVKVCFDQILRRENWIQDKHKDIIIRNANDLLHFHNRLLSALEKTYLNEDIRTRCGDIATVFLDMGSSFTLYDAYCDKHDAAIALCNSYRSKPEWISFVKKCIATPTMCSDPSLDQGTKPLHFEDYLIKPVQRVCRYQLLLKEILRHYTPHDTAEYRRLDCALGMMQAVVAGIDRRKYHRDTIKRTRLFIDRLDLSSSDGRLNKDSLHSLGNLVMAGVIDVTYSSLGQTTAASSSRSKYLGCFIFSTHVIMVRPKKVTCYTPKHWFPLRLTDLEDLQDIKDQRENAFVVRCKKHCFVFTTTCQREKRLWITKLSQAISIAKSQPQSTSASIGSSLHGIAKPAKLRTSRSVTNLLDIYRGSMAGSSSSNSASTSWIYHQYAPSSPRVGKSQQSTIDDTSSNQYADSIRRSKSLTFQLASFNDDDDNDDDEGDHLSTSFSSSSQSRQSLHPPPIPSTTISKKMTTTILTKRHSADFMPRTKHREQLKSRIHSEMYIKPKEINTDNPSSSAKQLQLRSGSMDLMSTSSSQSSLNMIGKIKSNHQHAMRIGADHKLKEVCTQDYLASRSWTTLLRESSNGNNNTFANNNGLKQGRRKSSLSNLRSSSSSMMLLGSDPSRRTSNGSSSKSTIRPSKNITTNDIVGGITSLPANSSTGTLDDNINQWRRLSTPQPRQTKYRSKKRLSSSSSSTLSFSTSSSASSSVASSMIATDRHAIQTKLNKTNTPISTPYGSLDFQQYYCGKLDGDSITKDLLPTMTTTYPTRGARNNNAGHCLMYPNQKKKTLRSSTSTYSLHIQPMTSNMKHAFVGGLRRFSYGQKQQYTYNDTSNKQPRQCGPFPKNSLIGSDHCLCQDHDEKIKSTLFLD
ncbi:hypothetical protein BC941DRAFT_498549 [Chlamydoabsidia padenii]|nr:hypothetical protein BC941DRAFT_498549 [Chlamydoabsidia padenii]